MRIDVETNHFATLTGWHIRSALKWIDNDDRQGLGVIRVIEHCPFDREANNLEPYLRGFLYNGSYIRKMKDVPAACAPGFTLTPASHAQEKIHFLNQTAFRLLRQSDVNDSHD